MSRRILQFRFQLGFNGIDGGLASARLGSAKQGFQLSERIDIAPIEDRWGLIRKRHFRPVMAGVMPGGPAPDPAKKVLPVTPLGRYLKILLSSSEFIFID